MKIQSTKQLIELIKLTRKKQGITQEQLADYAGLQRIGIVRIESGKTEPKISTVFKICQMLGLEFDIKGDQ